MWALPDINRMNKEAVESHRRRRSRVPSPRGKKCSCGKKATSIFAYHDLFGDEKTREIPKGYIVACDDCRDSGRAMEGLFECGTCGEILVTHYTWENYFRDTEDGDESGDQPRRTCLSCALDEALSDSDGPWLYTDDIIRLEDALLDSQVDAAMDWILEKAQHLIAVKSVFWTDQLSFVGNVEVDSSTGGRLINTGSSEATPRGAVLEIIELIKKGLEVAPRVALILDGAYQFSVSLGIYYELEFGEAELGQAGVRESGTGETPTAHS